MLKQKSGFYLINLFQLNRELSDMTLVNLTQF